MSAPRTVTVQTIDHGPVTMPEPAWCVGHDEQQPQYRIDISHFGPVTLFEVPTSRGEVTTMEAAFEQRPFIGDAFPGTDVFVWVGVADDGCPSTPAQLDTIAAALVEHAATLRGMARRLTALLAQEGK